MVVNKLLHFFFNYKDLSQSLDIPREPLQAEVAHW